MCLHAWSASVKAFQRAVGILCRCINSFANCLLDSIRAALRLGPKQGTLFSVRQSPRPLASGASGPIITKSTLFSVQYLTTLSLSFWSSIEEGTFCVFRWRQAVPALPGATRIVPTWFDCASFHAIACSLPPPPTIKTLSPMTSCSKSDLFLVMKLQNGGKWRATTTCNQRAREDPGNQAVKSGLVIGIRKRGKRPSGTVHF